MIKIILLSSFIFMGVITYYSFLTTQNIRSNIINSELAQKNRDIALKRYHDEIIKIAKERDYFVIMPSDCE